MLGILKLMEAARCRGNSVTKLIFKKAPRGKFRVIADNFGQRRTKHGNILVGDFDTMDQARAEAQPAQSRPWFEHWSVIIFDDKGVIV
jgi:hypothetical protein